VSFHQIIVGWRILRKISPKKFNNYTVLKFKCSKTNLNRNTVLMLNLQYCVSARLQRKQKVTNVTMDLKPLIFEDVGSIYVTQDSVQWRAVLNKGINLRIT